MNRGEFATGVCNGLGVSPSQNNIAALLAMMAVQEPPGAGPNNDPLCTEKAGFGGVAWNGAGVESYPTPQDGIDASVATLQLSYYNVVVSEMRTNQVASMICDAWAQSPWGGNPTETINQVLANMTYYSNIDVPGSHVVVVPPVPEPPAPAPAPELPLPLGLARVGSTSGGHFVRGTDIAPLPTDVPLMQVIYEWVSPDKLASLPDGIDLWSYGGDQIQSVSDTCAQAVAGGWDANTDPLSIAGAGA